jgi:hypothetical protein
MLSRASTLKKILFNKPVVVIAVVSLVLSFAVYGLLLLLPFLSLTTTQKAMFVTGVVISGEVFQWIGILLVGKELIARYAAQLNPVSWFRKLWQRTVAHTPPMETVLSVHVFKTSVRTVEDVEKLRASLDKLPDLTWSFDLEDCDHILRLEGLPGDVKAVVSIVSENGYTVEEL